MEWMIHTRYSYPKHTIAQTNDQIKVVNVGGNQVEVAQHSCNGTNPNKA